MAKLGQTIVSSALSGVPLTLSDKAFDQVGKQADAVAELKGQVAALTALLAAQAQAETVATTKTTKAKSAVEPKAE